MPAWQIFLAWKLESVLVLFSKNLERLNSVRIPRNMQKGRVRQHQSIPNIWSVIQDLLPHFGFQMVQTSTQGRLWGHRRQQTAFKSCTKSDQMKLHSENGTRIGQGGKTLRQPYFEYFGDLYLPSLACGKSNQADRVSKQGRLT